MNVTYFLTIVLMKIECVANVKIIKPVYSTYIDINHTCSNTSAPPPKPTPHTRFGAELCSPLPFLKGGDGKF